jgi:hypothetical protein
LRPQRRLFLLEMRGCMHEFERLGEDQPLGRADMRNDAVVDLIL